MKTICIIPARSGSSRIPKKNIRDFHGLPIIAYSIRNALQSNLFETIYVSTDCPEIASISIKYGAKTLVRPPELAVNEVGTQEAIGRACIELGLANDDLVCGLYATAPLLPSYALVEGLSQLFKNNTPFSKSVDANGKDIGGYYWGRAWAFKGNLKLSEWHTSLIPFPDKYCCDINVEADFERALKMYEELHGHN